MPKMISGGNAPLVWLIAITAALRLCFGWAVGLGVDESYMVAAGREVGLGYFDHPPVAWWLSRGAAWLFGTDAPIVVRLPFIALFALSTWLMARIGTLLADARVGFFAALLLNLSPVFGITSATWVLPDGPLDCALLGAVLCLLHALRGKGNALWLWWAGAGLCAGLALSSKYSAVLTLGGAFVFLLTSPFHRRLLRGPHPYVALLLACVAFAPEVIWNATHGWASFAFQGERAIGARFRPLAPFNTWLGEALFVLPWIWVPMMAVFWLALRRGPIAWRDWLLCCLAAPPIVAFAVISAWSSQRVLFHWAAPGYLMLFPLLGRAVAERWDRAWVRRTVIGTAALAIAATATIGAQTRFDLLGDTLAGLMRKDPTSEGVDWTSLRADLSARGLLRPGVVVGVPNWRDAGKVAYGLGPDVTVICLNRDARQFGVTRPAADFIGRDVLILVVDNPEPTRAALAPLFDRLEALPAAPVLLKSRVLKQISVFQGTRLLVWPPPA